MKCASLREHSVILFTVMRWDIFAGCPIGLEPYGMVMLFRKKIMALQEQTWDQEPDLKAYDESGYLCGETGCGLCALHQLKQAGITHLKLVGRGNYVDHMEKDIRNLRKALEILDAAEDETAFQCMIKRILFPHGCSEKCYY